MRDGLFDCVTLHWSEAYYYLEENMESRQGLIRNFFTAHRFMRMRPRQAVCSNRCNFVIMPDHCQTFN